MKAPVILHCPKCDSTQVNRHAGTNWNPGTQEWELVTTYDSVDCDACGANDITPEEKPYTPPNPFSFTASPIKGAEISAKHLTENDQLALLQEMTGNGSWFLKLYGRPDCSELSDGAAQIITAAFESGLDLIEFSNEGPYCTTEDRYINEE